MGGSDASGNKFIKVVEERRARMERLRHADYNAAQSRKTEDAKDQCYQSVKENACLAITQIDKKYRILMVHHATGKSIGKSDGEHIGRECFREFEKRRSVCPHCPGKQAMETSRPAQARTEGVRDDGSRFPVRIQAFPTVDRDGQITGFIEIIEDLTELQKMEEALQESEEKYRSLFENAVVGIGIFSSSGKILTMNRAMGEITGYSLEEISKINLVDIYVNSEDRQRLIEIMKRDGMVECFEVQLRNNKGQPYWASLSSMPFRYDGEDAFLTTALDITERKRAEEAYRSLVDHSLQGLAIFQDGRIVFTNQAMTQITGYTVEEMIAGSAEEIRAFVHPEDRKLVWDRHRQRLQGKPLPEHHELRGIRKDGSIRWLEINANLVEYQGIPAVQAAYKDVTERKRAENTLRESEERFRLAFEKANIGMCLVDLGGHLKRVNSQMCEMFGYNQDELESMTVNDIAHPEDLDISPRFIQRATSGEIEHTQFEKRYIHKQGHIVWGHVSSSLVRDFQGAPLYFISHVQDITKRKQAEEALRESEEKYRTILKIAFDGFTIDDLEGRLLEVNDSYCKMTGYTREELLAMSIRDLEVVEKPEETAQHIKNIMEQGYDRFETQHKRKDGKIIDLEISTNYIDVGEGQIFVSIHDITERRKVEEALRKSEEKFFKAFHSSPDIVAIASLKDGRLVEVNDSYTHITGYTREEVIGRTTLELDIWVETEKRSRLYQKLKKHGRIRNEEVNICTKSGRIRTLLLSAELINISDEPCMISVATDITDRKKAEEAYRSLVDYSLQGLVIFEDGRVVFANEAMAQIAGYTVDEMRAMSAEEIRAFVHPEDRDLVWGRYRQRLHGELPPERYELRGIRKDGSIRWLEIHASLIEYQGKPAIQTAYVDITERKRAEEQLLKYQARLKAMASQLSSIQERERRKLSVELHDRVTQKLVMVKLELQTLVGTIVYADAATRVKKIAEQVGGTIEDAYSLMLELSNPVLYEIGLKAAVDTLFQSELVKNCGIECRLVAPEQPMKIETSARVVLYQMIRELLVNAIKHSKAKEIEVQLCKTHGTASVTVKDDGVGFNPSDVKPPGKEGGFGLFNIRENIGGMDGEFTIESKPGEGTSATACVPLPRKDPPTQEGRSI